MDAQQRWPNSSKCSRRCSVESAYHRSGLAGPPAPAPVRQVERQRAHSVSLPWEVPTADLNLTMSEMGLPVRGHSSVMQNTFPPFERHTITSVSRSVVRYILPWRIFFVKPTAYQKCVR